MNIASIPSHVPAELVVDFDYRQHIDSGDDPHLSWKRLHAGPDIFWSPHNEGHWILTRSEDMRAVLMDHDTFSSREVMIPRIKMRPSPPIQFDPPDHTRLKMLGVPRFAPSSVKNLEQDIRALADRLIDGVIATGECEFIDDYSLRLPIETFMKMAGLPLEDRETLLGWVETSMRSTDPEARVEAQANMTRYSEAVIEDRIRTPGMDFVSELCRTGYDGSEQALEELRGYMRLLLAAGLDTVSSGMGFMFRFLAEHPGHRRQLVEEPSLIPQAIEEMLRRFGVSSPARILTRDTRLGGVLMKEGDMVLVPLTLAGLDERVWEDPLSVDFLRPNASHNLVFGTGIHRCIGSFLARLELRVGMEAWLARVPDFDVEGAVSAQAGLVNSLTYMKLRWDTVPSGLARAPEAARVAG